RTLAASGARPKAEHGGRALKTLYLLRAGFGLAMLLVAIVAGISIRNHVVSAETHALQEARSVTKVLEVLLVRHAGDREGDPLVVGKPSFSATSKRSTGSTVKTSPSWTARSGSWRMPWRRKSGRRTETTPTTRWRGRLWMARRRVANAASSDPRGGDGGRPGDHHPRRPRAVRDPARHRRDVARHAGAARRGRGVPGQERVPRHDEPRDPDADEWRDRDDRPAPRHLADAGAARVRRDGAAVW